MEQEISAMAGRDIEIEDESPYMEIDSGVAMMMAWIVDEEEYDPFRRAWMTDWIIRAS